MKHFGKLAVLSLAVLGAACGGSSGGGGGGGSSSSVSSQFIDAPVNGITVEYLSGATPASTANRGNFSCILGEGLRFKVKGLTIGTGTCSDKIFVSEVAAEDSVKAARLILTLSGVSDPTALADNAVLSITSSSVDFGGATQISDVGLNIDTFAAANSLTAPSEEAAEAHMNRFVALNAQLSTELEAELNNLEGTNIKITGTVRPGGVDCYKNFVATARVSKIDPSPGVTAPSYFILEPNRVGFYEDSATASVAPNGSITCPPFEGDPSSDAPCFEEGIADIGAKVITGNTLRFGQYESTPFTANTPIEIFSEYYLPSFSGSEITSFNFSLSFIEGTYRGTYSESGTYFNEATNIGVEGAGSQQTPYIVTSMGRYSCSYNIVAEQLPVETFNR